MTTGHVRELYRLSLNREDTVEHCSDGWNKLDTRSWLIMCIGMRDWAHGSLIGKRLYRPRRA